MASESDLDDLAGFLSSPSPQLRKATVDIVQGLSGTDDGIRVLAIKSPLLLPPLLKLLADENEISQEAAAALVNLSQNEDLAQALIGTGAVEIVMELLGKAGSTINRLLVMLLVNLTQVESGAIGLLQERDGKIAGLHVNKLVRFFTRFSGNKDGEDAFEHVAAILVNITRIKQGRTLLLEQKRGLLKQILPQIDSRSLVRRQGVAGTVRNCCFEADTELPSLLLTSQFLWPALLLPLAGKEAYSEEDTAKMPAELATPLSFERDAEEDPQVRIEAADALYLLALQEGGRRALWSVNGTRILQVGYETEEDPKVMEAYERLGSLVSLLKEVLKTNNRDQPPPIYKNALSSLLEEVLQKNNREQPPPIFKMLRVVLPHEEIKSAYSLTRRQ